MSSREAPAPTPILPGRSDLTQELSIVSSPQLSLEHSRTAEGHVQDLHGGWVRFGPVRVREGRPALTKTGRADAPFTASIEVTHTQAYSDVFPTQALAARAPLPYSLAWVTRYTYAYQTPGGQSGTWVYQDELDGALIDQGRR